jgi:hypothetical protein
LEDHKAIQVLQVIWNKVYQGDKEIGDKRLMYVVKKGNAIYKMVERYLFPMFSLLMLPYNCQAIQRATEWRSNLASTALYIINDFFDAENLTTTKARWDMASNLLVDSKYAFLMTKEVVVNGKKEVHSKL